MIILDVSVQCSPKLANFGTLLASECRELSGRTQYSNPVLFAEILLFRISRSTAEWLTGLTRTLQRHQHSAPY